jgi:hypothetical protein
MKSSSKIVLRCKRMLGLSPATASKKIKLNCWEYKKCGREPGGINAIKLGVCPASIETRVDGMNSGKNGGRVCWAVSGTLCGGKVQGTFAAKCTKCLYCDFYKLVFQEERPNYESTESVLKKLL